MEYARKPFAKSGTDQLLLLFLFALLQEVIISWDKLVRYVPRADVGALTVDPPGNFKT